MFKRNALTAIMGLMLITSGISSIAMAQSGGTLYVGTTDTNDAVTYETLENAINNASDGDTIQLANGEYANSAEVTTANLTVETYADTEPSVTINATNEPYGDAFYGNNTDTLTIGDSVTLEENQVYVGTTETAEENTYSDIQTAINNSDSNTTIEIASGTYNESLNVTSNNLAFMMHDASSGDVTIDARNTSSGEVFTGEYSDSVRVGQNLVIKSDTFFGGGIGDTASQTFMGIPYWVYAVVALIIGYLYIDSQ